MLWKSCQFHEQRVLTTKKTILQTQICPPSKKEGWSNDVKQRKTLLDFSELIGTSCSCFCRCSQQPRGCATQLSLQERIRDSPEKPPAAPSSSSASFQTPWDNNNTAGMRDPGHPTQRWTPPKASSAPELPGRLVKLSSLYWSEPLSAQSCSLSFYHHSLAPFPHPTNKLAAFLILS